VEPVPVLPPRSVSVLAIEIIALPLLPVHPEVPNDDAPVGEGHHLADLHHPVPARALDCGDYELGADIALAQVFLIHAVGSHQSSGVAIPSLSAKSHDFIVYIR
jgi:hypothetical protein